MLHFLFVLVLLFTSSLLAIDITFKHRTLSPHKGELSLPLILKNSSRTPYIGTVYIQQNSYTPQGALITPSENSSLFQLLPQHVIIPPNSTEYVTITYLPSHSVVPYEEEYRLYVEDVSVRPLKEFGIQDISGSMNMVYRKAMTLTVRPTHTNPAIEADFVGGRQWRLRNTGSTRIALSSVALQDSITQTITPLVAAKTGHSWVLPNETRLVTANAVISDVDSVDAIINPTSRKKSPFF